MSPKGFDSSAAWGAPVRFIGSELRGKRVTLGFEASDSTAQLVAEYLGRVAFLAVTQDNSEPVEVRTDGETVKVSFMLADDNERAQAETVVPRIKRLAEALHGLTADQSMEVLLRDAFLDVFFRINAPTFEQALKVFVEDEIAPLRRAGTVH